MSYFDDEPTGPFIHMKKEDFSSPECKLASGDCDLMEGLRCARYTGMEKPAAPVYVGATVCHGLRQMTDEEKEQRDAFGQPPLEMVCDIEIIVARDF